MSGDTPGLKQKPYNFSDLSPGGNFVIEFMDREHNPIKDIEFQVAVDGGQANKRTTDKDGTVNVPKPNATFSVSLASAEGIPDDELALADILTPKADA